MKHLALTFGIFALLASATPSLAIINCDFGTVPDATGENCIQHPLTNPATGQQCVCTATDGSGRTTTYSVSDCSNASNSQWSCSSSYTPPPTSAGNGNGNLPPYVPLEPLPGFDQSGTTDFSTFINSLFKIIIAVGAIIAVGMLVFSGVVYMVSGAVGTKSAALKRIRATLWGLLLLIASWLLLYTINPRLVGCESSGPCGTVYIEDLIIK